MDLNDDGEYIYFNNLEWPRYKYDQLNRELYVSQYKPTGENNFAKLIDVNDFNPTMNDFLLTQLSVPKKGQEYVDCDYLFIFKTTNSIPDDGSVLLTLPSDYKLLSSSVEPTVIVEQFSSSTTDELEIIISSNSIEIKHIGYFPEESEFTIKLQGIKNPKSSIPLTGFKIGTQLNGYPINERTNFATLTLGDSYSAQYLTFNSINVFPSNEYKIAEYTIDFTPATELPPYAEIFIIFPKSQFVLPDYPYCQLSGGLETFKACQKYESNAIKIITATSYTSGNIKFFINNIQNPDAGISDYFEIQTKYDNVFLDITNTAQSEGSISYYSMRVNITQSAKEVDWKSLSFYPQNEGENAIYQFLFTPTMDITNSHQIYIQFPSEFDRKLGYDVSCSLYSGMEAEISCSIEDRRILISGLVDYIRSGSDPIGIQLNGVINPNVISTATLQSQKAFYLGIIEENTKHALNLKDDIYQDNILNVGLCADIIDIETENLYARITSDYMFNFTLQSEVTNNTKIFIQFPDQFELSDKEYNCTIEPTEFMNNTKCVASNNQMIVSGDFKIETTEEQNDYKILKIQQIDNPIYNVSTDNIYLTNYDAFNKKIISKSYSNLSPFRFKYSYIGPLITINDNQDIIVEQGTQTKDLSLRLDYPCALDLQFKPTVSCLQIVPTVIEMNLGDIEVTFRVSTPNECTDGIYYIEWQTVSDRDSPFYTPIRKTQIEVTKNKNIQIQNSEIFEIPYGGNSLPITLHTDYAPDLGIKISLIENYDELSYTTKHVEFTSGQNNNSFTISYPTVENQTSATITNIEIELEITGINKDVYAMVNSQLSFLIISKIETTPKITECIVNADSITQTTVLVQIATNEITQAFYVVALIGTEKPSYQEAQALGPATYDTTQSQYGSMIIGQSGRNTARIYNLKSQVEYVLYCYAINRGNIQAEISSYEFETSDRHKAVEFSLKINQDYLNSAEKLRIIDNIAFYLSYDASKIAEKQYTIAEQASSRRLESKIMEKYFKKRQLTTSESVTMIYLQMESYDNTEAFPKPLELIPILNSKRDSLADDIQNFNQEYEITGIELHKYLPAFVTKPVITTIGIKNVTFQVQFDNYGYAYGMCLKAAEDTNKPTSQQIMWGFNSTNRENPHIFQEISEKYTLFSISILELTPETDYNLYIVGGSVNPGYPDLMNSDDISILLFKTEAEIIVPRLDINSNLKLNESAYLILLCFLLIFLIN